jgi:hypothetical protein
MLLKDGGIYRCLDGRVFRACKETKPYEKGSWTLLPVDDEDAFGKLPTRDRISRMLFVQGDRIYHMPFDGGPAVRDTGWTVNNLMPVLPSEPTPSLECT